MSRSWRVSGKLKYLGRCRYIIAVDMLDPDVSEISWIQKISGNLSVFDFQRFPKHRDKSEGLKVGFFLAKNSESKTTCHAWVQKDFFC